MMQSFRGSVAFCMFLLVVLTSTFFAQESPAASVQHTAAGEPKAAAGGVAKIHITSTEDGAEITVDSKFLGNTPSDITLPSGDHVITLTLGDLKWSRLLTVTDGELSVHGEIGQTAATLSSYKQRLEAGVYAAAPEMISFERVAPLLDGMYEDVAAIQMTPLQLSATNPNGTTLDAVQQSLQLAASYNSLDAVQNSANVQLFKANAALQQSLIDQLTQISAKLSNAAISTSNAQTALASLQAQTNPPASADELAKAQSALNDSQAQQAQLAAELNAVKAAQNSNLSIGQITSTTPGSTTANAAGGTNTPPTKFIGGSAVMPALPSIPSVSSPSPNGTATLPPTRQMDTQIGLLWDRMMRLLSTIGEPDSKEDAHFEFLRFYPSVTYVDKKTETLSLEYAISCTSSDGKQPRVLDVYPRTSPVNILSEKFKDNSFSLAAFFGFAAANASAAYNREHLQLTNAMAQASYITGFGAGSNRFGWILGKVLGDDTIAAGQKEMYALVAIPKSCGDKGKFVVRAQRVTWRGKDGKLIFESQKVNDPRLQATFTTTPADPLSVNIKQMSYSQSDGTSSVPITITLDHALDSQTRLFVNGSVLPRARDNFARATAQSSGAQPPNNIGLFELQGTTLTAGSWSRTAEKQLTVLLDPKAYGTRFPDVEITSPQFAVTVANSQINPVVINGLQYHCRTMGCRGILPGLLHSSAAIQSGTTRRWQRGKFLSRDDMILITLQSDQVAANSGQTPLPGALISSNPDLHRWGSSTRVTAVDQNSNNAYEVGPCKAQGALLTCRAWQDYGGGEYLLLIEDQQHAGGAARAELRLQAASPEDRKPLIANLPSPTMLPQQRIWIFKYPIFAVRGTKARLVTTTGNVILGDANAAGSGKGSLGPSPTITCLGSDDDSCTLEFPIPFRYALELQDTMQLWFEKDEENLTFHPTELHKLRSEIAPRLSSVDTDNRHIHGSNLTFDAVRFGRGGQIERLECADDLRTDCQIHELPKIKSAVYVYAYRPATRDQEELYFPLFLNNGSQGGFWLYTPPKEPARSLEAASKSAAPEQKSKLKPESIAVQ